MDIGNDIYLFRLYLMIDSLQSVQLEIALSPLRGYQDVFYTNSNGLWGGMVEYQICY